jgi:hypothetical protein
MLSTTLSLNAWRNATYGLDFCNSAPVLRQFSPKVGEYATLQKPEMFSAMMVGSRGTGRYWVGTRWKCARSR